VISTCVHGIVFNAAHYTKVYGTRTLHGHTFRVDVCVYGPSNKDYVIDFLELKEITENIVRGMDYSLLIPKSHEGKISINAPERVSIKYYVIDGEPTAENIAKHIAMKLASMLSKVKIFKIRVTVFEGSSFSGSYELNLRGV